jgi:hypothetical protein
MKYKKKIILITLDGELPDGKGSEALTQIRRFESKSISIFD